MGIQTYVLLALAVWPPAAGLPVVAEIDRYPMPPRTATMSAITRS